MKKSVIISFCAMIGAFVSLGYPFFKLLVDGRKGNKGGKGSWISLKHPKINHPRNGYEQKYEDGKKLLEFFS